ncbi:MAG: hypothetical protein OXH15_18195 [Gammaproteobacteria bacterium]|nr:hypothetical protein [Gammaproteobacteria bacterium]
MPIAPDGPHFGPRALALCAGLGYVVALAATLTAWHFLAAEQNARAMGRFGSQMADDLAYLAVEPMMRPDRIRLGLLAKRMAERPEVRSIEMYSVDGTELVVEGNPRPDGPTYLSQVAIQDTVAGHVRVMLHEDRFRPQTAALLARSWWLFAAGFVVVAGAAYGYGRLSTRTRRTATIAGPDTESDTSPSRFFVLVATMFPHSDVDDDGRADVLSRSMTLAERVANLYAAEAVPWRNTGLALLFPASTSDDRAFEVVCAALLVQRLLGAPPRDEPADAAHPSPDTPSSPFRLGLDLVTGDWVDDQSAVVDTASAEGVAVLASLAPNGALVLGRAAFAAVGDAERIRLQAFENPAFQTLSDVAVPEGIVLGTDSSHDALIAQQADLVVEASP